MWNCSLRFFQSLTIRAMCLWVSSTDLCVLKVIIYGVLQLPQFLLLLLLFLLLLLCQSGLALVIVLVVLLFLWCNKTERGVKRSAHRGIRPQGSPRQPACHRHWSSRSVVFLTWAIHVFGYCLPAQHLMITTRRVYHFTTGNTQIHVHTLSTSCSLSVFPITGHFLSTCLCSLQPESVEALHASSAKRGK